MFTCPWSGQKRPRIIGLGSSWILDRGCAQPTAHNYSLLITNLLYYHPIILNGHAIHYDLMYISLYKDTHYGRVHLAYCTNNTGYNQSWCRVKILASTNAVYRVQKYNNCFKTIAFQSNSLYISSVKKLPLTGPPVRDTLTSCFRASPIQLGNWSDRIGDCNITGLIKIQHVVLLLLVLTIYLFSGIIPYTFQTSIWESADSIGKYLYVSSVCSIASLFRIIWCHIIICSLCRKFCLQHKLHGIVHIHWPPHIIVLFNA